MFDIGAPEFLVIAVVALVVLGPERLPELMRRAGRLYGQLRQMSSQITGEFQRQLEEGMRDVEDVSSTISGAWQDATSSEIPAGPPPRLLQVAAPLVPPDSPALAGPWNLAARQRDAHVEPEVRPRDYPSTPTALAHHTPKGDLAFDDFDAAGGPSLLAWEAEADGTSGPAVGASARSNGSGGSVVPGHGRERDPSGSAAGAGSSAVQDGAARAYGNGAPAGATRTAASGTNGSPRLASLSAREITVVELYRAGDLTLEKAAGFLGVSPEDFSKIAGASAPHAASG